MSASKSVVKKSVKDVSSVVAPVVVAAPTPPLSSAVIDSKKAPAKATAKASAKASAKAPAKAPAVAAPVPTEGVAAETDVTLQDELKAVQDQLTTIRDAAGAALTALKRVAKRASQDLKEARKTKRKPKAEDGVERKPSNFEIPVPISDELSIFLGGGKGAMMSRAEVNKRMFAFSKDNFLSEGQAIHLVATPELLAKGYKPSAAAALIKLLVIPDGANLTIFNIQKYMGRHYSKSVATAKGAVAPPTPAL